MPGTVSHLATIVRGLVSLVILGLLGTGGWIAYTAYDRRARIEDELAAANAQVDALTVRNRQLAQENQKLAEQNARLSLALRLLKVDHRVAQIEVLDQHEGPERPQTRFRFVEQTTDGSPVGEPREFTVEGDTVYIDAWVIKYADELVEEGDPLRSTSVCLFRRIFGEYQEPSEGFPLDAKDSRPSVYSHGNEISSIERDIWENFWKYANDPERVKKTGLRAAHGEAPSIRLEPGKRYRVELRASAGLTIRPEDIEAKPAS
jgi:hypothetical protein